jgi:putative flippase GtrA
MKKQGEWLMTMERSPGAIPQSLRRWIVFNIVGGFGFVVQLSMLAWLVGGCGMGYMPATVLAVETAVIHNFLWHEHWTWGDRAQSGRFARARRFLRFNLTNGGISILGNMVFMWLFMNILPVNYLAANILAIAVCAMINFVVSDRLVFRGTSPISGTRVRAEEGNKEEK